MKEWNARAVMNANNTKKLGKTGALCLALLLSGSFPMQGAWAAGSAPALSSVKEIQVKHARFGNEVASDKCGLTTGLITEKTIKKLKELDIPAFSVMETPNSQTKPARIELAPEIVTLQRQEIDCISWIALTAMSREVLTIPPIPQPRAINVVYWRGGLLISSSISAHGRAVEDAMNKLATQFAARYRTDQPPPLPDFD